MKKSILAVFILFLFLVPQAFAYYETGDQVFSFRAGVDFPSFISFVNDPERGTVGRSDTHLKMGGIASISYQGFLNPSLALGGELGYQFNYSLAKKLLTVVPLTAKLTFYPVQNGKLDLWASVNLGGSFLRYNNGKYFSPYLGLTAGCTAFFTDSWGVGIESGISLVSEFYGKNNSKHLDTVIAGFIPLSLNVSYRH